MTRALVELTSASLGYTGHQHNLRHDRGGWYDASEHTPVLTPGSSPLALNSDSVPHSH